MLKTYRDSKEFPLFSYERIVTTGNFFYMIKGYDGEEIEADQKEMQSLFNEIVQDYVISLNAKNQDILNYGKIKALNFELLKFSIIRDIIILQIKHDILSGEKNKVNIEELLQGLKIQRNEDLHKQIEIIDLRIEKIKNDILEFQKKIERPKGEEFEESDINEIITNVELILERTIDLEKTSLYRFGIMQEQANKKIQAQNKKN